MDVFILTIKDEANFQRLEHKSVWSSYERALEKGKEVVSRLLERDKHLGFGNTYSCDIQSFEVQD